MNTRNTFRARWISMARGAACAAALTAVAGLALGHDQQQSNSLFGARLTGTWRVTVVTYNCADPTQTFLTFPSYLTFSADGTLIEVPSNPSFLPGQRSSAHGFWKRLGFNFYRAVTEGFIHFPNGAPAGPASKRGYQRIEQGIELTSRDSWTAEATTSFFDVNGTPYFTGCARATGERLE